jgi:hypothetical protein
MVMKNMKVRDELETILNKLKKKERKKKPQEKTYLLNSTNMHKKNLKQDYLKF